MQASPAGGGGVGQTQLHQRGHLRQQPQASGRGHRQRTQLAGLQVPRYFRIAGDHHRHLAAQQVVQGRRAALVRHMQQRQPGLLAQQFHRQVLRRAVTGRSHHHWFGRVARQGHEFGHVARGKARQHYKRGGAQGELRDWREVAHGVERQALEKAGVDRERPGGKQQRVAIGRGACHDLGADVAGRTGLVVDHHLLLQTVLQMARDDARDRIRPAAGRPRHHEANRLLGVGRESRCACDHQQRGRQERL